MNNGVYIAISLLIVVLVGEMIGYSLLKVSRPEQDVSPQAVLGSSIDTALVKKLCENYHLDTNQLMQKSQKPRAVQQCGKYYRIDRPEETPVAPYKIVDKNGEVVAVCGGADFSAGIASFEQKECEVSCSLENLCSQSL